MYDPMFVLATTTVGRDVRTVVIDGQIVMKDRVFQTVDLDEVKRRLDERFPKIMERFEAASA
jgi:5-methylthioadenosine/S-adenosylhomocysteine deaminase